MCLNAHYMVASSVCTGSQFFVTVTAHNIFLHAVTSQNGHLLPPKKNVKFPIKTPYITRCFHKGDTSQHNMSISNVCT